MTDKAPDSPVNPGAKHPTVSFANEPSPRQSLADKRSDSNLPPHEREDVTKVPVTPGIHLGTYHSDTSETSLRAGSPSYFRPHATGFTSSPDNLSNPQSPSEVAKNADSPVDILRRMSLKNALSRRESLTEIRQGHPDLALSGNIISATFRIPYAVKYKKEGDWVGADPYKRMVLDGGRLTYSGTQTPTRAICSVRFVLLPVI